MAELKTKENKASVKDFLNTIENEQKRADCFEVLKIMEDATGQKGHMWGGAIVGFGRYHYKYDSGHEGDSCKVGFSPRKANITFYIMMGSKTEAEQLKKLGKHKVSGSCLHINKLADVDKAILKKMVKDAYDAMTKQYG
ncbi:MAG: hypothetical protein K0Q79_1396 [Flavipsychrobacter sp.]|jgi:hypothetical protein|nr:hypothetical protein [Flavipsychrobacter sp.]